MPEVRTAAPAIVPAPLRLIRYADALTFFLLALAACIVVGKGVRLSFGPISASFSSATTLIGAALAVSAFRHWRAPRPSQVDRLLSAYRTYRTDPSLNEAIPTALLTRAAVLAIGLYASVAVGFGRPAPFLASSDELANLQARWDAGWYLSIASVGYQFDPRYLHQQNIVFFPAYPLLVRIAGQLLGGATRFGLAGGTLISIAAFTWALVRLHRLAALLPATRATAGAAGATVVLLACYPFAVFFGAVYTESLFLLATVSAIYWAERRRWWATGAWGLLAGLARPNGAFLSVPLAILVAVQLWRERGDPAARWRQATAGLAAAAMPGIGMLMFSAYMSRLTGDPLQWVHWQVQWGRSIGGSVAVAGALSGLLDQGVTAYIRNAPGDILDLLAVVFALALLVPVTRTLGLAYGALVAVNLGVMLVNGGLLSTGRLTSTLFPLFLWLGCRVPAAHRERYVVVFALGQALVAVLFYTWRPPV